MDLECLKSVRILLVEDNDFNAALACQLLAEQGAVVDRACHGQDALAMFEKSEPGYYQGILMDLVMPVMGGLDASRAIRNLARADAKQIPIIALTSEHSYKDQLAACQAGMDAYLYKPLDIARFQEEFQALRRAN